MKGQNFLIVKLGKNCLIIIEIRCFINLKLDDVYVDKKAPKCYEMGKLFESIIVF